VSMTPCDAPGASATRRDLLAGGPIEVRAQPVELHARSAPERRQSRLGPYESMTTQRRELANRDPIPGHNEGFALVKLAHDLAAVIAKLTLSDLPGHTRKCSTCATRPVHVHRTGFIDSSCGHRPSLPIGLCSIAVELVSDGLKRVVHAVVTDQPDVQPGVLHDCQCSHHRVDAFVGVAERPAAHTGQQHDVRHPGTRLLDFRQQRGLVSIRKRVFQSFEDTPAGQILKLAKLQAPAEPGLVVARCGG
jgi:hypothetical protein